MTVRYRTLMVDSERWEGFEFRSSDIVISTPPKCGTTWTQMLCAMLIFDGPDFPAPLSQLSPWLDQTIHSLDSVRALYAAQQNRRFIKTHTPLDGLPMREDIKYVVVGRDPRDVMVSMEHHLANMDLGRVLTLRDQAVGNEDLDSLPPRQVLSEDATERFRGFVRRTDRGGVNLSAVMHHLDTAWQIRHHPNLCMCHYADFSADLPDEIARLADFLDIKVTRERAKRLAAEATLDRMCERADDVIPNAGAIWRDDRAFFRAGSFGEWRIRVNEDVLAEYDRTLRETASPELAIWAHHGRLACGIDPSGTDHATSGIESASLGEGARRE